MLHISMLSHCHTSHILSVDQLPGSGLLDPVFTVNFPTERNLSDLIRKGVYNSFYGTEVTCEFSIKTYKHKVQVTQSFSGHGTLANLLGTLLRKARSREECLSIIQNPHAIKHQDTTETSLQHRHLNVPKKWLQHSAWEKEPRARRRGTDSTCFLAASTSRGPWPALPEWLPRGGGEMTDNEPILKCSYQGQLTTR